MRLGTRIFTFYSDYIAPRPIVKLLAHRCDGFQGIVLKGIANRQRGCLLTLLTCAALCDILEL
ncbi:MAG: hypothetical protein A2Z03_00030 [Chloroflexi bacterium RBG_16_56_8]|nr:MAG: hypothetical protein A2Z03_00030 [Chloroflexi bacterium RBG_16_56_8]